MASIIYTVILLVSFLFLVRKREETESNFTPKIIAYFILGSFAFYFNHIALPLGFIVYLLFCRPKLNIAIKRSAAIHGILAFILVHWVFPFAANAWESRPISFAHKLGSVYTINFQDENEFIKQELNLEENSLRVEDFDVEYVKSGRIKELRWQLVEYDGENYTLYQVRYDPSKSSYQVLHNKAGTWLQYDRLIDAERFFDNLEVLNIKDITQSKGDFSSYVIKSTGERVNYGVEDTPNFMVSEGKIELLDVQQLPVEGYDISTFAMKKTGEERNKQGNITQESFESTESASYLFDVTFGEEQ